jgi:hypothetical protein
MQAPALRQLFVFVRDFALFQRLDQLENSCRVINGRFRPEMNGRGTVGESLVPNIVITRNQHFSELDVLGFAGKDVGFSTLALSCK